MAKKKFEDNMQRLNEIAEALENSDVALDVSLKLYKEAVQLAKVLREELDSTESAVTLMQKELDGTYSRKEVAYDGF